MRTESLIKYIYKMKDFKVVVNSTEEQNDLLLVLFKNGYRWPDGRTHIPSSRIAHSIVVQDGQIWIIADDLATADDEFDTVPHDDISIEAAKEVKYPFVNVGDKLTAFIVDGQVQLGKELFDAQVFKDIITKLEESIKIQTSTVK